VVGSGQSGAQIAEDLHLEGRRVHLVVGNAPRVARFYRGRDVTDWLDDLGYYRMPVTEHPRREAVRAQANHYVTGRDGGRDIDLRKFALEGMRLHGRLIKAADDLDAVEAAAVFSASRNACRSWVSSQVVKTSSNWSTTRTRRWPVAFASLV